MTVARCSKCKAVQDVKAFAFRNKAKGKRNSVCKACMKVYTKKHYEQNKEDYKQRAKDWAQNNPELRAAVSAEHTSRKRTESVCDCCSRKDFLRFYLECPKGHHVDHIDRLSTGGQHCTLNMQYLTASEHGTKSNMERWHDN